jgi:hypothetical protein
MSQDMARLLIQAAISAIFLTAGFAVLFLGADPTLEKLAAGWVGAVLGFWLQ